MATTPTLVAIAVAVAVVLCGPASAAKLPASFKRCKFGDPQLGGCLQEAVGIAVRESAKGLPSLGLLPIDPLLISALSIGRGKGPVDVSLDFKDLNLNGISSAIIDTAKLEEQALSLDMDVRFGKPITLDGNYRIEGQVLVLPINGEGRCKLTFDDLKTTVKIRMEKFTKDGETFARVTSFGFSLQPSNFKMDFENLFNGDKALGDNMNKFLNENWQEILKELQPAIEQAFGATFQQVANTIFNKVPYKDLQLS